MEYLGSWDSSELSAMYEVVYSGFFPGRCTCLQHPFTTDWTTSTLQDRSPSFLIGKWYESTAIFKIATLSIGRILVSLFPNWILYVASLLRRPVGREKVLYGGYGGRESAGFKKWDALGDEWFQLMDGWLRLEIYTTQDARYVHLDSLVPACYVPFFDFDILLHARNIGK